ncbi:MAG TPA: M13 family metallopeptidase, partial [Terriglobales bacterium]
IAVSILVAGAIAQTGPSAEQKPSTTTSAAQKAVPSAAPIARPKSFDLDAMDKSADPCVDFYQYACGAWRKNNPIPPDQPRWGRFNELAEYNRQVLHDILEKDAADDPKRSPVAQKIGDFYQSCMDEAAVNAKGTSPIKPDLDRIAAIKSKSDVIAAIADLQSEGVTALFAFRSLPDLHNASMEVANVSQGGLGLPDRDYYIAQDAKSQETRDKYLAHMTRMFTLLGDDEAAAKKEADAVMGIESKLAAASYERVKMRDPKNRDHKMKVSDLVALAPNFEFQRFFQASGAPPFAEVNVVPPDFFQQVSGALPSVSLEDWKTYLRWHTLRTFAPALSLPFVQENFEFYGHYLAGQQQLQVRWKRCVQMTDQLLGEALGQPYVDETFGAEGKERMLAMVNALEKALAADIEDLPWMTADTRKQAEVKLQAISNKIGYPEKWRDYGSVKIVRGDLLGNTQRARAFEVKRILNKIGKPLDKAEWTMTPPTVNAYYNPSENDINFPAGILQPPFFEQAVDDAVNFGGIGVVIGHELTHGFDDQGSKFDAQGNLTNWWTDKDRQEFEKRTGCVADEYASFVAVDDVHLNGRLTLGENTADNGGLRIARMALNSQRAVKPDSKANQTVDGFTPEQRFFLGFAQVWCENRSPESERLLAKTDPHSPGRYRVKGSVQNDPDFAKAFGCKSGQPMISQNACRVW